jgi:hypothetical protein
MNFLDNKYIIISVIGSHAGEEISLIFSRKQEELKSRNETYWLVKSFKAKTSQIQNICKQADKERESVYCLFIESSSKNGARPTIHDSKAQYFSVDGKAWTILSEKVKITGKLDLQSTALVLDELKIIPPQKIDLWNYSDFENKNPVKLQLGASTVCCIKISSKGMLSRFRNVVAVARLKTPYAIWVK